MVLAGLFGIARRHEQLAHAGLVKPGEHLLQVRAIPDEPRGQMWHHRIAHGPKALAELERGLEPLARGGRDSDLDVGRQVFPDLILDPSERKDLEARTPQ